MKHRTREAIFNLVGPEIKHKHAVDLFAGTGALGLEAISRGASRASLIERHIPTARLVKQNIAALGVADQTDVIYADTFAWVRQIAAEDHVPWAVFCSPPYDFYVDRREDVVHMIDTLIHLAPKNSVFVVESDDRFDFGQLPNPEGWDIRRYAPARIGVLWWPAT